MILNIDLETYSPTPIGLGVYKYAEESEILIMAYSTDDGPIHGINVYRDGIPSHILELILDESVTKSAFNAQFERIILSNYISKKHNHTIKYISPINWRCSYAGAAASGVIGNLGTVANILGTTDGQKDKRGTSLIRMFSVPKKDGSRIYPEDKPLEFEEFIKYCIQDVKAEMGLDINWCNFEAEAYERNQLTNDKGILLDIPFIEKCVTAHNLYMADAMAKLKALTGLENPNSTKQFGEWLHKATGEPINSLDKAHMAVYMEKWPDMEALKLKSRIASSSVKKFQKMLDCVCVDGRIRGTLVFYGAGTGRERGALMQPQNLPRDEIDEELHADITEWGGKTDIEAYKKLKAGEFMPSNLKGVIRPCLIAPEGKLLAILDFSAIEAVVLAFLSGQKDRMEVFKTHGKIYEFSASKMFNIPIDSIKKGHDNYKYRQKGKTAELALGYQGALGALEQMGATGSKEELLGIVGSWRKSNPKIVELWKRLDENVKCLIQYGKPTRNMSVENGNLYITLPSGRDLVYRDIKVGLEGITYNRVRNKKWVRVKTYGGKLCENIVQAVARDLMYNASKNFFDTGYIPILQVHDEIVLEVDEKEDLEKLKGLMCGNLPQWAKTWPIKSSGDMSPYYLK